MGAGHVGLTILEDTGSSEPTPQDDVLTGTPGDDIIDALQGDDIINGLEGRDVLIGGRGSDTITGGQANDVITTDELGGANNGFDQDIIILGDVDNNSIGNDVITDFDTNNYRGGENNFDTLSFTFDGVDYDLSTGRDIVNFVYTIEHDGDYSTDAIRDGNDIIFVFGRDENDVIVNSVRLEDVIGDDGIWNYRLNNASIDYLSSTDVFADIGGNGDDTLTGTNGREALYGEGGDDMLIGGRGSDILRGGEGDDILTGDEASGANNTYDRDSFLYGDVDQLSIGNDVITDFDTNNYWGGENNFDRLSFTFEGVDYHLSTGRDIVNFVHTIEHDGDTATDALRDGNDIIFVFGRDAAGNATDSIRLEDVIGDDGITNARLDAASIDDFAIENTAKPAFADAAQPFFNTIKYGASTESDFDALISESFVSTFDFTGFDLDFSFDFNVFDQFSFFEMSPQDIERFDRDDLITDVIPVRFYETSFDPIIFEEFYDEFGFHLFDEGFRFDNFLSDFETINERLERLDIEPDINALEGILSPNRFEFDAELIPYMENVIFEDRLSLNDPLEALLQNVSNSAEFNVEDDAQDSDVFEDIDELSDILNLSTDIFA